MPDLGLLFPGLVDQLPFTRGHTASDWPAASNATEGTPAFAGAACTDADIVD
jgi:hypothetical protein